MGHADYYASGDWNAVCFECGKKFKASTMKKHWQGYYVCPRCWEPRQPQDFVRAVADVQTPPWVQPVPTDRFAWESIAGLITTDTTLTPTDTAVNGGGGSGGTITITPPTTPSTLQRIEIGNAGEGTVIFTGEMRKDSVVYVGVRLTPGARIWLVWGGTYWEWENEIRYSTTTTYIITTVTHATWTAPVTFVLSGGDLVATYPAPFAAGYVVSSIGKSSGKWYCEITATATGMNFEVGATPIWVNDGQILGIALDMDTGTVYRYINNVLVDTETGLVGPQGVLIDASNLTAGCTGTLTANFGESIFTYTVPEGYDYGLYDEVIYVWHLV